MIDAYLERFPKTPTDMLGRLAISLFRGTEDQPNAQDNDYFGIGVRTEEGQNWHLFFERYEEMTYLAGIALTKERQQMLKSMLRANDFQTAMDKFGWQPLVAVEDEPSQQEQDAYADWIISKDPDLWHDLNQQLREEFEDDGA